MRNMVDGLRITVGAMILAIATAGCALSADRVPGCVAPANEAALLDELAKDPVLDVALPGATKRAEPRRQEACHRIGGDVSRTAVGVEYDLAHDPSPEEVRAAFEPVATKAGWVAMPNPAGGPALSLHFCRDILGQPSLLTVDWEHAKTVGSERIPGHLAVGVHGSAAGGRADIEASRRAAGCRV